VINLDIKKLSLVSNSGAQDQDVTRYGQHTALTVFPKERRESDKPFLTPRGE
jgi:hypothetical protein